MLRNRIAFIAVLLAISFPTSSAAIEQQDPNRAGRRHEKRSLGSLDHNKMLRLRRRPYGTSYEFFGTRYYTGPRKNYRYGYHPSYYRNRRPWPNY